MDKLLHFLVGAVIAAAILPLDIVAAAVAVVVAAVGKEVWDSTGRGHVEALDAVATVAGGLVMGGWLLLMVRCL